MPVAKFIYALVLISVKSQSSPSACIGEGKLMNSKYFVKGSEHQDWFLLLDLI